MAEQNNQAERAAFEAWHRSKFATKHSTGQPTRDMHNGIYAENYGPEHQQQMWEVWQAARRAALPEAVDAEGLPALPEGECASFLRMDTKVYTAEQVRQAQREAIAADRRKQAALTQMIELGQEIEASGERQSIDTDEFKNLLTIFAEARDAGSFTEEAAARRKLIAYIDGRTSGAANQVAPTDDRFAVGLMSELARRGASPAGLSLAAQLLDVAPCEKCGYRKLHCRCEIATPSQQSPGKEGA